MSKNMNDTDCNKCCKSKRHGTIITSAITKRAVSDNELASFLYSTCCNFNKVLDKDGQRTALHMAASCGRDQLTSWLAINSPKNYINMKDGESGFTALHRAVFYGHINAAVALLKNGAGNDILDKDILRPLDHSLIDRQYIYKPRDTDPCDVYVWGTNKNYTLGTQEEKHYPDVLNCFSRSNITIKQVCLGKFHSVWLDSTGSVWACGQASRLGASQYGTVIRPTLVRTTEPCQCVALTTDSTVVLTVNGQVYQYSQSETQGSTNQTNKKANEIKPIAVKPIIKLQESEGLCSSRHHCAVWNKKDVFTWGLNFGQLGHSEQSEKIVPTPKKVKAIFANSINDSDIELVNASETATVVYTKRGDLYLLHNYMCKKIVHKLLHVKQVCVESKLKESGGHSRVTVFLINSNYDLLIWQDTTDQVSPIKLEYAAELNPQLHVKHMSATHDAIYFTSQYGSAYVGRVSRKESKRVQDDNNKKLHKSLKDLEPTLVRIEQIPNIHRAISINVDTEGLNFACLQYKPSCGLVSIPAVSPSTLSGDLENLLLEASPDDLLHDVVFKIGYREFPAHMFLVSNASEHLYNLYKEAVDVCSDGEKPVITLVGVHPDVFDKVLKYIYTGTCDVLMVGPCRLKVKRVDVVKPEKRVDTDEVSAAELNLETKSAFEVYNNGSIPKRKSLRRNTNATANNQSTTMRIADPFCDPVKLLQATAKRLQVMGLHKALDKFYYKDGAVVLKEKSSRHIARVLLDRTLTTELVDTYFECEDGATLPAHKCILAARLEYFKGMFIHSWVESKVKSKIPIQYKERFMVPILNFLYTDQCPEIEQSDSIEFVRTMLIVADQLFIKRLGEMCEVALASMINLKNCSELCQFAHNYNAKQLKCCAMEFISLNISNLLELGVLEGLTNDLLTDLTLYHRNLNPIMSSRVITPFSDAPSDIEVSASVKNWPVDLTIVDSDLKIEDYDVKLEELIRKRPKFKKEIKAEKERSRNNSKNYDVDDLATSLDKQQLDNPKDEIIDQWVKITHTNKQSKIQARLNAINKARDIMNETIIENPTILSRSTSQAININHRQNENQVKSPQGSLYIQHIGSAKVSQKMRKKLALENRESPVKVVVNDTVTPPRNPWKVCEAPIASPVNRKTEFNDILADQRKQKDDYTRIISKSLTLTQLEDKAIEDLERFYNISECDDEYITIRRIDIEISSPKWINTSK